MVISSICLSAAGVTISGQTFNLATMVAMLAIFIALFFKQQLALAATVNLKVSPV
jgi:hypothetical protein